MKRFSFLMLLMIGLFAASIFLNACQKEAGQELAQSVPAVSPASDRAASHVTYGVTLFSGDQCKIYGLDQGTGGLVSSITAFYIDPFGINVSLDNLKGICLTSWGEYYITTGVPGSLTDPGTYDNALFKVNLSTGRCELISTNPDGNTVSDLEHMPSGALNFYGLSNNSNAIIEISTGSGSPYTTYSAPAAITGIAPGYLLKGLSLVRDGSGMYLVGCATSGPGLPAKLYTVPALGGAATFMTDLAPASELGGGHCALGFDLDLNKMLVNRNTPGLNSFNWTLPFGPTTSTNFWGGGYSCEDLTSSVY